MTNSQQFNAGVRNQGFIAILTSILVVIIMVVTGTSVANLIITQQKISSVSTKSLQAYFAADSGIEDAIFRIRNGILIGDSYSFQLEGIPVNVELSEAIGGSRTITSQADKSGVIKKIGAVHTFDAEKVEFFFGAQIGDGGVTTSNGSHILGNVFSNGSISGSGEITDDVIISGTVSTISGVDVGGDAKVPNCNNVDIEGVLYRVSGGSFNNCDADGG